MSDPQTMRAGDYELLEQIGNGAQGRVFKARCAVSDNPRVTMDRIVAVKMLSYPESDPSTSERIRRSADLLMDLSHESVVRYIDELERYGYIDIKRQGLGKPNVYTLRARVKMKR